MIQLTNVSKSYGDSGAVQALHNLSLTVEQGERVAVMGPSGSGKSTLLNLICGLDAPTSGSIKLEGIELAALDDDRRTRLRREKLGMIFQTFNLLSTLTALENVALPLRLQGLRRRERTAPRDAGARGAQSPAHHRPDELSGGERRAWPRPRTVFVRHSVGDEPTHKLDSATGEDILRLL
jgi:putative ABC transport system ATP-binding protein